MQTINKPDIERTSTKNQQAFEFEVDYSVAWQYH